MIVQLIFKGCFLRKIFRQNWKSKNLSFPNNNTALKRSLKPWQDLQRAVKQGQGCLFLTEASLFSTLFGLHNSRFTVPTNWLHRDLHLALGAPPTLKRQTERLHMLRTHASGFCLPFRVTSVSCWVQMVGDG